MSDTPIGPNLQPNNSFEQSLASLMPKSDPSARDEIMFAAGRRAGEDSVNRFQLERFAKSASLWPLVTAASWILTCSLLFLQTSGENNNRQLPLAGPSNQTDNAQLAETDQPIDVKVLSVDERLSGSAATSPAVAQFDELLDRSQNISPRDLIRWSPDRLRTRPQTRVGKVRVQVESQRATYAELNARMFESSPFGLIEGESL